MPKLAKFQKDAILADHAKGYSIQEISVRNDVHRNTVSRHVSALRPPVAEAAASATAGDVAAVAEVATVLAAYTMLIACGKCGKNVPVVTSMPTLTWRNVPCGYLFWCKCGNFGTWALPEYAAEARAANSAISVAIAARVRR